MLDYHLLMLHVMPSLSCLVHFPVFTLSPVHEYKNHIKIHKIEWLCFVVSSEEPELLLDANMARDHLAMLGTDITLSATISGVPTPTVSWKKNDGDAPAHAIIATTVRGSKLFMPKAVRADSGNYTITVENAAGKKSATVAVLVLSESNKKQFHFYILLCFKIKYPSILPSRQAFSSQRPGVVRGDQ